jgi:UDP-2,3-diacylglucosamine pyrophosphatase LpxH
MNRAIFVSDVHLGSTHCHAAEFADFLGRVQCRQLYLVGDIVDLWWMAQRRARWDAAHQRVVEALHALARSGTELIYVPGNHDRAARRFCGLMLPAMQVRRRVIHTTADGRRLLVVHGDDYDAVTRWHLPMPGAPRRASTSPAGSSASDDPTAPLTQGGMRGFAHRAQYGFGDWLYYRILTGNKLINRLRRRLGLRYWSLAQYLKRKSTAAERYIARFVQAGLDDVRTRRLDGIVCGHIHRAALIRQDGLVYANDGDWVESLTALCETADGTLQLLAHTGQVLGEVPARLRLVPEPERPLPRAA